MQKWIKNGLLLALFCVLPGGMADAEEIQQIGQGHFTGTISHDLEGNIVLDFTDIQLTLPSGWSGKCAIKAGEDNVTFYQKGSYDLWAQEGAADGGRLFEISFSQYADYLDLPSYESVGTTAEGYYYVEYPTDFGGYTGDENVVAEFQQMQDGVEGIVDSVEIKNSAVPQNTGYILPLSSTNALEKSELEGMDQNQVQMAINEIYARHHRKFTIEEVRDYFEAQPWYSGYIEPEDFDVYQLNTTERGNIDLMVEYMKELG